MEEYKKAHNHQEINRDVVLRMFKEFGPCTAAVLPEGEGVQRYEVPEDPKLRERHEAKVASKLIRWWHFASLENCPLGILKSALMPRKRSFWELDESTRKRLFSLEAGKYSVEDCRRMREPFDYQSEAAQSFDSLTAEAQQELLKS